MTDHRRKSDHHCPQCDDGQGEHTRLYGCRFDDLHDWPGVIVPDSHEWLGMDR